MTNFHSKNRYITLVLKLINLLVINYNMSLILNLDINNL